MHRRVAAVVAGVLMVGLPSAGALAQGISHRPSVGVMAGVNLASISGEDISGIDNRTGFLAGVFLTFHVTNTFAIQPEAIYSQKGASDNSDPDFKATFKMDYVDFPVLLRFDIPVAGPIRPFFVAGPAFGVQVKCAIAAEGSGVSASADCDLVDESSEIQFRKKSFDLSGVAGAGLDFKLGGTTLMVGARYEHGLTDVVQDGSIKNRTWSVVGGVTF
jgi:hypothetical protein